MLNKVLSWIQLSDSSEPPEPREPTKAPKPPEPVKKEGILEESGVDEEVHEGEGVEVVEVVGDFVGKDVQVAGTSRPELNGQRGAVS